MKLFVTIAWLVVILLVAITDCSADPDPAPQFGFGRGGYGGFGGRGFGGFGGRGFGGFGGRGFGGFGGRGFGGFGGFRGKRSVDHLRSSEDGDSSERLRFDHYD